MLMRYLCSQHFAVSAAVAVQVHEEVLRLLQAAESQPSLETAQLGSLLERMLRASRTSRRCCGVLSQPQQHACIRLLQSLHGQRTWLDLLEPHC